MVVYNIFFFVCGLSRSLAWDYAPGVPQGEEAERRVPWREKPIGGLVYKYLTGNPPPSPPAISAIQWGVGDTSEADAPTNTGEKTSTVQATASSQPDRESATLPPSIIMLSSSSRCKRFLQTLYPVFAPINVVIGVSLCIALVQPLKALFVDVSAEGGPSWKGPDGKPPLAFIIDTGSSAARHG